MADTKFILFPGRSAWRIARCGADGFVWSSAVVEENTAPETVAASVAVALREQGHAGGPVVLALASDDCLSVRVATTGLPRGDRRAMIYRLEEQLPVAAE